MNKNESKYFNTACLMDEALLALLEKKDYEYITVQEITKKAGVNRSTFYLHYESIDDLLEETINLVNKRFNNSFDLELNLTDKLHGKNNKELIFITPKYLRPYLNFIKENKKIFCLSRNKPQLFKSKEVFEKMYNDIFEPILINFNVEKEKRKYIFEYYSKGILGIVTYWVDDECKLDVEKVIEIMIDCLNLSIGEHHEIN